MMVIMQALGTRECFAFGAVKQNRDSGQNALHQRGKRLTVSLAGRLPDEERFVVKSGIYQIENQVNGKTYIGSAVNIGRRWQNHLAALRHGRHDNEHLQRAFIRYGEVVFVFSVLECVEDTQQLIPREQHFLDTVKPEYNMCRVAGSTLGRRLSIEARRKLSKARMGMRHTQEVSRKIGEANRGSHRSEETRKKMSESHKGKIRSKEHCRKLSEAGKAYWRRVRAAKSQALGEAT